MDERKALVARGYDAVAEAYAAWQPVADGTRRRYIDALRASLPTGASVLDLGCGTGAHATADLADEYVVVGVDISVHSLRVAREGLNDVSFVCGDIGSVAFAPSSFDAVVAFYSLIHVPRTEHAEVLSRIEGWLRPGGTLIATMGAGVVVRRQESSSVWRCSGAVGAARPTSS